MAIGKTPQYNHIVECINIRMHRAIYMHSVAGLRKFKT